MSGFGRRFDPSELAGLDTGTIGDAEAAALLGTARELEAFATSEMAFPGAGFEERVMGAVALEPPLRPLAAGGTLTGFLASIRDAWRIVWAPGRPAAIRAQALAFLLLVALAVGSVGALAAVGAARLLTSPSPVPTTPPSVPVSPPPSPSIAPTPSVMPSPSVAPSPTLTPSPRPTATPDATETADPTGTDDSGETAEPTGTDDSGGNSGPGGSDDGGNSGPGGGGGSGSSGSGSGSESSGSGSGGSTPDPDDTPEPPDD